MVSRQVEQGANFALGAALRGMMRTCTVRVENTRVVVGQAGLRLDILVTGGGPRSGGYRGGVHAGGGRGEGGAGIGWGWKRWRDGGLSRRLWRRGTRRGWSFRGTWARRWLEARLEYAVFHRDGTRFPGVGMAGGVGWGSGGIGSAGVCSSGGGGQRGGRASERHRGLGGGAR